MTNPLDNIHASLGLEMAGTSPLPSLRAYSATKTLPKVCIFRIRTGHEHQNFERLKRKLNVSSTNVDKYLDLIDVGGMDQTHSYLGGGKNIRGVCRAML